MVSKPIEPIARKPGAFALVFLVVSLLCFTLAYWQITNNLFWETTPLVNQSFIPCDKTSAAGYCFKLPPEWSFFAAQYLKTVKVTEDGVELQSQDEVGSISGKHDPGWFAVTKDHLVISPSGNNDPRQNNKIYQLVQPIPLPMAVPAILGICGAAALWVCRSILQQKILLPAAWFILFVPSAKSIFPGLLWGILAFGNLLVIYFLLKGNGSGTLTRRQMFTLLVVYSILLVGAMEIA